MVVTVCGGCGVVYGVLCECGAVWGGHGTLQASLTCVCSIFSARTCIHICDAVDGTCVQSVSVCKFYSTSDAHFELLILM